MKIFYFSTCRCYNDTRLPQVDGCHRLLDDVRHGLVHRLVNPPQDVATELRTQRVCAFRGRKDDADALVDVVQVLNDLARLGGADGPILCGDVCDVHFYIGVLVVPPPG